MPRYLPFALWPYVLGFVLLGLALPRAIVERSALRFLHGLAISVVGVLVPLGVFLLSAFLVPDWKGACKLGWLDCFHLGKLALLPAVLWATTAFYAVEVLGVARPARWIALGLWTGAVVAAICFIFGIVSVGSRQDAQGMVPWLAVPFYVAIWHGARAWQMSQRLLLHAADCGLTFLGSLPFWLLGLAWSRRLYQTLPDVPPSCFVVTAASRGHESLVGPLQEVTRNGRLLRANCQLLTLWQFEALWSTGAPFSHQWFRRIYNVLGPRIADKISVPWLADLAYIGLKPAEYFAAVILCGARHMRAIRELRRTTPDWRS